MLEATSVDFIIYHANCSDGFGAAYAAWKCLGNKAIYHAAKHGSSPPNVAGKNVAILDFTGDGLQDVFAIKKENNINLILKKVVIIIFHPV